MDIADLRAEIPPLETTAYCNWGATGPCPESVLAAADDFQRYHEHEVTTEEDPYPVAWDHYEATREAVADLLGADAEEVALTGSTADGLGRFLGAFDWDADDVVVTTDVEHPASDLPLARLERVHGIEVRVVETDDGYLAPERLHEAARGATLVAFSGIDWLYGCRQPVGDLVDAAHDAGALALVDAVQCVGQMGVDVHEWGADAVAAAGHKWLMGTWGSGFLYVERELAESLAPAQIGYRGVTEPTAEAYEWKPGATRFEVGTENVGAAAALQESVATVQSVGLSTVEDRIETLTDRLKAEIPDERLWSPRAYHSGLVTVAVADADATVDRLQDAGVIVRSLPTEGTVRVSLHAVNTEEHVDRVAAALA